MLNLCYWVTWTLRSVDDGTSAALVPRAGRSRLAAHAWHDQVVAARTLGAFFKLPLKFLLK